MAESAILVALETLRNLLLEETKFLSGLGSQVKGLETQLKEMQCLLEDVDRSGRQGSKTIRNWIVEIRDLAYKAEDVIETYSVVQVSSRRGRGLRKLFQGFSCILNHSCTLYQIGLEISDIKSDIARVYKSIQEYGIRRIIQGENSAAANENQRWKRKTYAFETDDCFVGMEDDLKRLVSLTVDGNKHRVISVWGMGGIGKTTLVRKVYNHVEVKRAFESFAWVCITQQCQIRHVFEEVLKQLMPQKREDAMHLSDIELVEQLFQVQEDKRCLIVLDDLWKMEHLNGPMDVFLKSKVLLTTRKQNVADVGFAYKLGLLNVVDGWELLKRKAFQRNYATPPDFGLETELFDKVGKKMVENCGYLPLVISLLGGILSKKQSLEEWELVNRNIDDYLFSAGSMNEDNKINEIVLDFSYDDLPSYLKPCFLYMGQFAEDQYIYGDNLYMLWIAEGLISVENRAGQESLMDVAERYLSELASRCIVQVVVEDTISSKRYVSCHLHDVVRELCLSKGKKEDFRLKVVDCHGGRFDVLDPSVLGTKTRYLAIHFREEVEVEHELTTTHEETNTHIRSLKFINHFKQRKMNFPRPVLEYFQNFKLIRVLVFEGCNFQGRKLPKEIGNLIHLRYLRLRNCAFAELPSSISNLIYLSTLDLFHSWDIRIPNVLNKMIRLKHLFLPYYKRSNVRNCALRLEGLNKLETLVGFNSLAHDFKFVSRMKNLQRLQATVHDAKTLSEIIDDLNNNRNNLRESTLVIKDDCELTSTGEGRRNLKKLLICPNLHSLWIDVHMRKLSEEFEIQTIFPRLVFLTLRKCEIENDPMQILETLPCLESLCLWPSSYVGKEMTCRATGFRKLKTLQVWGLPNLTEWRVEKGAMHILSELEIRNCPYLEEIPHGLRLISSLEELEISEMPGLGKRVLARKRGFQQCLPCSFRHHFLNDS